MLTTIAAFVVTVAILIASHEWGHYLVARSLGVKVLRFSIGFGPVLLRWSSRNEDHTEFVLSLVPLGGFVKMLESKEAPLPPEQLSRAFDQQSPGRRALIAVAGPVANVILAAGLYAACHWLGTQELPAQLATPEPNSLAAEASLRAGDQVVALTLSSAARQPEGESVPVASLEDLRWLVMRAAVKGQPVMLQVVDAAGGNPRQAYLPLDTLKNRDANAATLREIGLTEIYSVPVLGEPRPGGPAARAGLRADDLVIEIDGVKIADVAQLKQLVSATVPPAVMHWRVLRAGQMVEVAVEPRAADAGGVQQGRIDVGLGRRPNPITVRFGFGHGLTRSLERVGQTAELSARLLGRMFIGQSPLTNLSGPLTIADYAGRSVQRHWTDFAGLLAALSIGLGVLNLLPLPPFDGGQIVYCAWEAMAGKPVSEAWNRWLMRGGVMVFVVMMSFSLANDLSRVLAG